MSWLITPQLKSVDGVPVGTPYGGGYVAGFISYAADPLPTHALITAPAATGATGTGYTLTTNLKWKTTETNTGGTASRIDGLLNTNAISAAGISDHPAAEFCVNLSLGGFSDWYLPAIDELRLAYDNLKPTTAANNGGSSLPVQTSVALFASPGAEAFSVANHWSSWITTTIFARRIRFDNGFEASTSLITEYSVRAFRRIAL